MCIRDSLYGAAGIEPFGLAENPHGRNVTCNAVQFNERRVPDVVEKALPGQRSLCLSSHWNYDGPVVTP
jgi:hypothetical protein